MSRAEKVRSGSGMAVLLGAAVVGAAIVIVLAALAGGPRRTIAPAPSAARWTPTAFEQVRYVLAKTDEPTTVASSHREVKRTDPHASAPGLEADGFDPIAMRTVELPSRDEDLFGLDATQQNVISDEKFRSAIAAWDAPRRCANSRGVAHGAIKLKLKIAPNGHVISASPRGVSGAKEAEVATCMKRSIASLQFPASGGDVPFNRDAQFVF